MDAAIPGTVFDCPGPGKNLFGGRARLVRGIVVVPALLFTHLRLLAASIDTPEDSLPNALAALITDLGSAIPSYCGLELRIADHDWPIILSEYSGDPALEPVTSLRIALPFILPGAHPDSSIVFYAATPGTFVDLAADLSHAAGVSRNGHAPNRDGSRPPIDVDADPLPRTRVSGLAGITELATINRAIGFLIGQGHTPGDARDRLHRGAASARIDTPTFAARLLR